MSNTHLGHYYGPAPSDAELGIGVSDVRGLTIFTPETVFPGVFVVGKSCTTGITPEDREAQRRSFAFGNVSLSNPAVTRELVDRVADEMLRGTE